MLLQHRAVTGTLLAVVALGTVGLTAQQPTGTVESHLEAARTAAGDEHTYLFSRLCAEPIEAVGAPPAETDTPSALPSTDPDRDWYAEPVRVFDDLFFLGQTGYSVWGLRTAEGIILVDSIFDYSVEAEVIEGLRTLGIDPGEIRYLIISHAHRDHSGGAGILQRHGARVVMSEADWDLYERGNDEVKATRDIVATDGMELQLGDVTIRTYITPGHTLGTVSTLLPVSDGGEPHMAAVWGGTLFNFRGTPDERRERFEAYAASAARFREIALEAGTDVILSNHTAYDGSTEKMPILARRGAGDPHPYVIGTDSVSRFLTVAEECAEAALVAEAQ